MDADSTQPDSGTRGKSLSSARHKGDRVSTPSLGSSAKNSPGRNPLLRRRSKKDRHAKSRASRSPSLRHQPGSSSNPLPPCDPRRRRPGRLSLGHGAQGAIAGDRKATVATGLSPSQPAAQFTPLFGATEVALSPKK